MTCSEIVVFEVAQEHLDDFITMREQLITETKATFSGFMRAELHRNLENPALLVDIWSWQDWESARAGFAGFSTLPSAPKLVQLVKKQIFSGHFNQLLPTPL